MPFDLVAFDCDGVLVDSEPLVNRLFLRCVGETGPTLDEETTLRRFTGVSLTARLDTIREETGWQPAADFEEAFLVRLDAAVTAELRPVEGIERALDSITLPRCVVSNGLRNEIIHRLSSTGLLERFAPHLFSARECPRTKPFPDVYLHAAATMGMRPEDCAAVEDSEPGVRAAVAAGMTVFGYAPLGNGPALAALGARPFARMDELEKMLGAGR